MSHLEAFAEAAEANGGSRSVLSGYNDSAAYVLKQLEMVDFYDVIMQPFLAPIYEELEPPTLEILGQDPPLNLDRCEQRTGWQHYYVGCDYAGVRYGGNGSYDVISEVQFVENSCSESSWRTFTQGHIALVEIGSCGYYEQGLLAEAHFAAGIIFMSTLGSNSYPGGRVYDSATWNPETKLIQLPCIGVTHAIGQLLRQDNTKIHITTNNKIEIAHTFNIIAESYIGDPDKVVMMGSHLDSVPEGPGINDNGSGSANNLEIALEWARKYKELLVRSNTSVNEEQPRIRFGWWGAEEIGLVGSRYYVDQLVQDPTEFSKLLCYLNYDMEAGPNYIRLIHDASTSPNPDIIPASEILQRMFEDVWIEEGLSFGLTGMTGGSDFLPFVLAGVPSGGLATGAGGLKSEVERKIHGGLANTQLDPCYHAPCDTLENINQKCLSETSIAATRVLQRLVDISNNRKDASVLRTLERLNSQSNITARQQRYKAAKENPKIKIGFSIPCNANEEKMSR